MSFAENTPKVVLDTNESLFTVFTAINTCGYDTELSNSDSLREQVRDEVAKAVAASSEAHDTTQLLCQFYADHQLPDASRNLAQYVSLALYLGEPPTFTPRVKEADLPPDASRVLGVLQLLQQFYKQAGLHAIWLSHAREYASLTERYHEPLAKMLFDTEIYLKLPSSGYLGHQFVVYLEPMGAPGQGNARNYGLDYYVVISPGRTASLKMEQIRHTYLHYLLDPLAMKYPYSLKRLDPILVAVKPSPMDENFKSDAGLLVTECLIRAVEARTLGSSKTPEAERLKAVQDSVEQGFVLTPYFYQQLEQFEKGPIGLRNAIGDMLGNIDVGKEQKAIAQIHFASKADPELLHLTRPNEGNLLRSAEQKLAAGDPAAAQALAQQALDEKSEDSGRALFILAQVATMKKDMAGAQSYFERALQAAHEPKVVAWSHIYLGRIFDLQEEREQALSHYRAAMSAGAVLPEIKAAAEQGLSKPYEPPAHPRSGAADDADDNPK